jgi:hypothetical protein
LIGMLFFWRGIWIGDDHERRKFGPYSSGGG